MRIVSTLLILLACSWFKPVFGDKGVETIYVGGAQAWMWNSVASFNPPASAPDGNFPQQDEFIKLELAGGQVEYYKRVLPSEVPNP